MYISKVYNCTYNKIKKNIERKKNTINDTLKTFIQFFYIKINTQHYLKYNKSYTLNWCILEKVGYKKTSQG